MENESDTEPWTQPQEHEGCSPLLCFYSLAMVGVVEMVGVMGVVG